MAFILKEAEVIFAMKLINRFEIVIHTKDGPIAGVGMTIDWKTHEAMLISSGEDYDDSLLDGYDRPGSVTETVGAMREYIDAIKAECEVTEIQAWYLVNQSRIDEHGIDRVNELMGRKAISPKLRKLWDKQLAEINTVKNAKAASHEVATSDLPEAKSNAW